eukprot:TRINITY_DN17635_c0_g1_i2.p1 TRINITY_DN17635_c0_g1~~TRINITY_DN17635_c0_g1_i2.p1  ORF type:complete len:1145 (+),score=305.91 TRINITY_DN17635_c0_g1_i2:92-3526(+)
MRAPRAPVFGALLLRAAGAPAPPGTVTFTVADETHTVTATLKYRTCASHVCAAAGTWNWAGHSVICGHVCTDAECCTDGKGKAFSPDHIGYGSCSGEIQAPPNQTLFVQNISHGDCNLRCSDDQSCWGFSWTASSWSNSSGLCELMNPSPRRGCVDPQHLCFDCRHMLKALLPWFLPSGDKSCFGLTPLVVPTSDPTDGHAVINIAPAECQRLCDDAESCAGVEWDPAPSRRDFRDPDGWRPRYRGEPVPPPPPPAWSTCRLWATVNCTNGTLPNASACMEDDVCFYLRSGGRVEDCRRTLADYLSHYGPIGCLVMFGFVCLVSCVIGCASLRKGSPSESTADRRRRARMRKFWCVLFLVSGVPLLFLGLIAGTIPGLRADLIFTCPLQAEPPWGRNTAFPEVAIDTFTDKEGTATVNFFEDENSSSTGHLWERTETCMGPSAWGHKHRLPPPESRMWSTSAIEGMPNFGEYDMTVRCGYVDPEQLPSAESLSPVLSPEVRAGKITRVVQVVQYASKDDSCTTPVWEVIVGEGECISLNHSSTALAMRGHCSACEWLKWEGVKNAPYQMLVINSFCSLVFSGLVGLLTDTLIPFVGDQVARFVPCFRRNCGMCTSHGEVDDDVHFCPCAPNPKRRQEMTRDVNNWGEELPPQSMPDEDPELEKLRKKRPCCSDTGDKLTCVFLRCPGLCDLYSDWKHERGPTDEEGDEDSAGSTSGARSPGSPRSGRRSQGSPRLSLRSPPRPRSSASASPERSARFRSPPRAVPPPTPAADLVSGERISETEGSPTGSPYSFPPTTASREPRTQPSEPAGGDMSLDEGGGMSIDRRRTQPGSTPRSRDGGGSPYSSAPSEATSVASFRNRYPRKIKSCCRAGEYFRYWLDNIWRWFEDNIDRITEQFQDDLGQYEDALGFARSKSATTLAFIVFKSLYIFVFFFFALDASLLSTGSQWDRYQILYVRLVNSGSMLLLYEAALGADAALAALKAAKGDMDTREVQCKAQFNLLLTFCLVLLYLPALCTHVLPMAVAYPWVILVVYLFGFKVFVKWPEDFVNNFLASDWALLVSQRPYRALIYAHALGLWRKFTSSFLIALPLQMFFNYAVLLYSDAAYWSVVAREIHSRSWSCFLESHPEETPADHLQLFSFFF